MSIVTLPNPLTDGTPAVGSQVYANDNAIASDYNGNITNANISGSAAIADTKLAQISTAAKVSTTALTGTIAVANLGKVSTGVILLTIGNRSDTPATGVVGDVYIPFACTITASTLLADQSGSIVIDIWKVAYASYPATVTNTITASALPTLSSAISAQDTTLTGWTTSISAGDCIRININSATTLTQVVLALNYTRV